MILLQTQSDGCELKGRVHGHTHTHRVFGVGEEVAPVKATRLSSVRVSSNPQCASSYHCRQYNPLVSLGML